VIETIKASVIGVGDVGGCAVFCKVQEKMQPVHSLRRTDLHQEGVVLTVHRQDVVERLKVTFFDLAGAQMANGDAARGGGIARARVWRLAYVIAMGSGGIDGYFFLKPGSFNHGTEDALCRWRTADVAHADEKNADHVCLPFWCRPFWIASVCRQHGEGGNSFCAIP